MESSKQPGCGVRHPDRGGPAGAGGRTDASTGPFQPVILRDSERLFPVSPLFETNINILTVFLLNKCFQEMIESMGSEE